MKSMDRPPLRALVVEDEYLLLALLEDLLPDLGFEVTACAGSLEAALAAVRSTADYDVALVDVNLSGTPSYDAVDRLLQARVPTLFITGYGAGSLPPRFASLPVLTKPFGRDELCRALARLSAQGGFDAD